MKGQESAKGQESSKGQESAKGEAGQGDDPQGAKNSDGSPKNEGSTEAQPGKQDQSAGAPKDGASSQPSEASGEAQSKQQGGQPQQQAQGKGSDPSKGKGEPKSADQPAEGESDQQGDPSDQQGAGNPKGSPNSGGTRRGGSTDNTINRGEKPKDQAEPKAPPSDSDRDDLAPDAKTELTVRQIKDILQDPDRTKQLEKDSGLTRDQMEQFVRKFEKPKQSESTRPGGEIEAKPGQDKTIDPSRTIADPIRSGVNSGRRERAAGGVAQDQITGQSEGARIQAPAEWRARFEAYRNTIAGASAGTQPSNTPPPKPPAGSQ
jgi:hypothetical protein